jgi:pimeloyl-ACP methyl ester carboxylesterase
MTTEITEFQLPVADGRLHVRAAGTGPPVVLLHGGALDGRMWAPQFATLTQAGFRAVAMDARGHGHSTTPTAPFRQCDDVAELVQRLGGGPAILAGVSMGAGAAVDTALEHPELVSAVVAVGAGTNEPTFTDPFLLNIFAAWQRAQEHQDVEAWLDAFLLTAAGPHRSLDEVDPEVVGRLREMGRHTIVTHTQPEAVQPEHVVGSWERLGEVRAPVLAVLGELDASDHQEMGRRLAASVQHGRATVIAGTAHYPMMERPEEFDRVLLSFLSTIH